MDYFIASTWSLTNTWTITYSWWILELTNINILDNFSYSGTFLTDSPFYTWSLNETSTGVYTLQLKDYTPKINEVNQNIFEIKIILLIMLFFLIIWFTYSLILSFLWKRL